MNNYKLADCNYNNTELEIVFEGSLKECEDERLKHFLCWLIILDPNGNIV